MPIARDEADIYTYTELSSEAAPAPLRPFFSPLPLKWVLLLLLVFQNSASTILVTHTRSISPLPGRPLYLGSAAVLVSECLKLSSCLAMITHEEGGVKQAAAEVWLAVVVRWRDTRRMAVPALCYGLQNVLFYVALSNLTPTAYQLWSQSKTLVTALFFVTILKQVLKPRQWFALGLLTAGVGLVQVAEVAAKAGGAASVAASAGGAAPMVALGVAAVLASSVLSGFANVYFEKVLKEADLSCEIDETCAPASLWMRNVQQGIFAIPQAAALLLLSAPARATVRTHGLLAGFTPLVWLVTVLTAGGGLLVAGVVKHADNVLKTYATAVAILATCAFTAVSTGVLPSVGFMQGLLLVIGSMFLYNSPLPSLPSLPRLRRA